MGLGIVGGINHKEGRCGGAQQLGPMLANPCAEVIYPAIIRFFFHPLDRSLDLIGILMAVGERTTIASELAVPRLVSSVVCTRAYHNRR